MSGSCTRRGFLRKGAALAGAATAAGLWRWPYVMAAGVPAPKLGVAVVGAGGMGGYSVGQAYNERLVAVVDVVEGTLANVMREFEKRNEGKAPAPRTYFDYRKMLDECHRDLDVVLTGTPDHHHAPASIRAINLGKAAFAQKPLAHDIRECYVLAKAAKEKRVCTQMGNQGHCGEGVRRLVEYIWAGAVGNVTETHTILGRDFGGSGGRPPSKPVPQGLHWDEWIGPAPFREYHDGLHPFSWRSWRQFGTGTIGDMACHHMDGVFWALKLYEARTYTIELLAQRPGSEEMFPQSNVIRWQFGPRGTMPPVTVYAYDHEALKPQVMRDAERMDFEEWAKQQSKDPTPDERKDAEKRLLRRFPEFSLFVGERGLIGGDGRIIPNSRHQEFASPPRTLPRAHGHGPIEDLFWCIRNNGTPASNFTDAAGPLAAFVLSGHLAMFAGVGRRLEWDVEKMECTNVPEINRYVRRDYRAGWEV